MYSTYRKYSGSRTQKSGCRSKVQPTHQRHMSWQSPLHHSLSLPLQSNNPNRSCFTGHARIKLTRVAACVTAATSFHQHLTYRPTPTIPPASEHTNLILPIHDSKFCTQHQSCRTTPSTSLGLHSLTLRSSWRVSMRT